MEQKADCDVLMLLDNTFERDGRVEREVQALRSAGLKVCIACMKRNGVETTEELSEKGIYRLFDTSLLTFKGRRRYAAEAKKLSEKFAYKVIHAHDNKMLSLGYELKKCLPEKKLIYDSHEYLAGAPIHFLKKDVLTRMKSHVVRTYEKLTERRDIRKTDALITVGNRIRGLMCARLPIPKNAPFEVVRNVHLTKPVTSSDDRGEVRRRLGYTDQDRLLVFMGSKFFPGKQNLEMVFNEMRNPLENLHLVMIGGGRYIEHCKNVADNIGARNTKFIGNVSPKDIHAHLCAMDIGLLPIWNKSDLSYWNALPNKIFEYINAGLPVVTTSQPEYLNIISESSVGLSVNPDKNETFLGSAETILRNYSYFQSRVWDAKSVYNWETESEKLISIYRSLQMLPQNSA